MTVGELVRKRVGVVLPTKFEELRALCALVDLGIWDAEVLEGPVTRGIALDGPESRKPHALLVDGVPVARFGERVRVIVLPQEEK